MPLEIGTWSLNASGIVVPLQIESVDIHGHVAGTITTPAALGIPSLTVLGFWDESAQKLVFQAYQSPAAGITPPGALHVFTGFLFTDQFRLTGVAGSVVFTLAGYFEVLPALNQTGLVPGTSQKCLFGWYAQIGVD